MKREYDQNKAFALAKRLGAVVEESGVTIAETLVALSMTMGLSLIADVMKQSMEMEERPDEI